MGSLLGERAGYYKESYAVKDYKLEPESAYRSLWDAQNALRQSTGDSDRDVLNQVLSRPEFLPFLPGSVTKVVEGHRPVRVGRDGVITIARIETKTPILLALRLRRAFELRAWTVATKASNAPEIRWARLILAFHTSFRYLRRMEPKQRAAAEGALATYELQAYEGLAKLEASGANAVARAEFLGSFLDHFKELDDATCEVPPKDLDCVVRIAAGGLALACPVEELLTSGGDERLYVLPETGLNKYGCSPRPRPWASTFSTCTASSISPIGYWAAELQRQSLFSAALDDRLPAQFAAQMEIIRDDLKRVLRVDSIPGVDAVLTPSGTDAELIAVYCATRGEHRPIVNVVIAPREVGSGTLNAAAARHFDAHAPLGKPVTVGSPIEGFVQEQVRVCALEIRGQDGQLRDVSEVDGELEELVMQAHRAGEFVMVHLLDCSKTGFGGPSVEVLRRLKRDCKDAFAVIVDAAQMRVSRRMIESYLRQQFMVIVTGSKFFTGPPFSGALLVPNGFVPGDEPGAALPLGLRDYCGRSDFPETWRSVTTTLSNNLNVGLMLRWRAALWEMEAFFSVPATDRRAVFSRFANGMQQLIGDHDGIEPVLAPVYGREYEHADDDWDSVATIFSFLVSGVGVCATDNHYLTYEEAKKVYHWLNMDLSGLLPSDSTDSDKALASHCCHIGQPVSVTGPGGEWIGALRIAVGARLISRVAFDPSLGATATERLAEQLRAAGEILDKISLIRRNWSALDQSTSTLGAQAQPDPPIRNSMSCL